MLKGAVLLLLVLAVVGTLGGPARPIYQLKILRCNCSPGSISCTFRQMGYGYVVKRFSSGSVSCRQSRTITNYGRTVLGWEYTCSLGSTTGQFEISTIGGRICGTSYDRVMVNDCRAGRPCSAFG